MRCTKEWVLKSDINNQKSLIDRLLEVRGIVSEDAKREFLHPLEITLMHPNAFCDMQKAVERIIKAIDGKENINYRSWWIYRQLFGRRGSVSRF